MAADLPPAEELLEEIIDGVALRLWTATPGRVTAYDPATQTAHVQPLPYEWDGQGGQEALPVLPGVPVMFPRGNGFAMTWPLAKGDHVLLVFCRRSIERWRATGADGDPQSDRHHNIADAFAIPGAFHVGGKLADVPAADVEIREPTGGGILVGQGATQAAARQGDTVAPSAAWAAWFAAVAGVTAQPVPVGGFASITGGSAVVKVK